MVFGSQNPGQTFPTGPQDEVLTQELQAIVSSDAFLSGAELQICTGPYFLCHMLQQVLDAPMLIYHGYLSCSDHFRMSEKLEVS